MYSNATFRPQPSASASIAEPRLDQSDGQGRRAGLKPRRRNVARKAFHCAVFLAASIRGSSAREPRDKNGAHRASQSAGSVEASTRLSKTQTTQPTLSRTSDLRPATSSFYSAQWTSRTHIKCRAISDLVFSTRHFSRSLHLPVSVAESARGAGASHTLPSQIHSLKGLR